MPLSYSENQDKKNIVHLRELLSSLPLYCKDFFRSIEHRTTTRTRLAYAYDLGIFFKFLSEVNPSFKNKFPTIEELDNLSFMDIEEYMEYLKYHLNDNKKDVLNSEQGIKRKIASLKTFYNYFYKNELIKNNPALLVTMPKIRQKEIIRLEIDEVVKLLDAVESGEGLSSKETSYHKKNKVRDIALLSLLLGTGIRVSECVGININDIDKETHGIRIHRKGGKEVIIYYSDEVSHYLNRYIDERKKIISNDIYSEDALFLSLQNKRINVRSVENIVKKYSKIVVPLKHITPHKLRSTYGTNLYKETGDIYLVADVLGHEDVNTTKKHYAAIEEDRRRNARNIVKLRDN
ncbi:MAG: tyrosine-type recombinase/integrase [Eubacteriales bacterium]|nr:tyrosine-type recombinase/integrase [Eubacteriales bacterium]